MLNYQILSNYFLRKGDKFDGFWSDYLSNKKKVLYVLGLGFDPRTLLCFDKIFKNKKASSIDCMVIQYNDTFEEKEPMSSLLHSNISELNKLVSNDKWNIKTIDTKLAVDYSMSVDIVTKLKKEDFKGYTDIIVDISAMPNGIYFPLIKTILDWIHNKEIKLDKEHVNLHVVVAENAKFDSEINSIGLNDKVTPMYKFSKNLESVAKKNLRKIWIPLLGENQIDSLNKLNEEIIPKEVSPIFPVPSIDPYRAKNLLLNYREFLFETLELDAENFVYANEQNPFETFRQIYETAQYYYESFEELKGCNIVITPMASKLLCLGSFLAAYVLLNEDTNIGIAHIENQSYSISPSINIEEVKENSTPFTIWLTGDVYEQ